MPCPKLVSKFFPLYYHYQKTLLSHLNGLLSSQAIIYASPWPLPQMLWCLWHLKFSLPPSSTKSINDHTADPSNVPSLGDLLIANDLHFFSIWAFHTIGPGFEFCHQQACFTHEGLKHSTLIMDSDLPTLPFSLCQLLDLMGSFSSFHSKWISPLMILLFFLGIIDLVVYPSGVCICVCTRIHATSLLFWIMYFYWYRIYKYYIICSKMHKS